MYFARIFFLLITALFKTEIIAISNILALCQYGDNDDVNAFILLHLIV